MSRIEGDEDVVSQQASAQETMVTKMLSTAVRMYKRSLGPKMRINRFVLGTRQARRH